MSETQNRPLAKFNNAVTPAIIKNSGNSCGNSCENSVTGSKHSRSIGVKLNKLVEPVVLEQTEKSALEQPRTKTSSSKRMHILCDLDSTLINSLSTKDEIQHVSKEYQRKFSYADMKNYYRIFERPYLQYFLDFLFANFDVSIFTAADKDYALFISEKIILTKPDRQLKYLFYGVHSSYSESYYKSPKDLRLLWDVFQLKEFSPCSTLIIDDLHEVFLAQPFNTIPAPKFEILHDNKKVDYTQASDNFLLSIIPILENKKKKFQQSSCSHALGTVHSCQKNICKMVGGLG